MSFYIDTLMKAGLKSPIFRRTLIIGYFKMANISDNNDTEGFKVMRKIPKIEDPPVNYGTNGGVNSKLKYCPKCNRVWESYWDSGYKVTEYYNHLRYGDEKKCPIENCNLKKYKNKKIIPYHKARSFYFERENIEDSTLKQKRYQKYLEKYNIKEKDMD